MKNVKNLSVLFILTLITSSIQAQGGRDLTGTTVDAHAFKFEGDLISFNIEVENDTRTHTNHWSGASLDFSGIADESDSHKKNLKFRLTDDEY